MAAGWAWSAKPETGDCIASSHSSYCLRRLPLTHRHSPAFDVHCCGPALYQYSLPVKKWLFYACIALIPIVILGLLLLVARR